jgi:putative FmdB family regulatory protein
VPLRTYVCDTCKNKTEKLVSTGDPPKLNCEICGNEMVVTIGNFGFVLKGSGWARDGYSGHPKASTPLESTGGTSVVARIPEYADRNTGNKLGFGEPEVITVNK